jgi:hypothetical protein
MKLLIPSGTERPAFRISLVIAFGKSISIFDHQIFQLLKPSTMTDSQEIIKALLLYLMYIDKTSNILNVNLTK